MTALLVHPSSGNLWSSMPGWGIVADLTPPELVAARHLKVIRKVIGAAVALVLVLCVAGYALAFLQNSSASDSVDSAKARTSQLNDERHKYAKVTAVQAATKRIAGQVAALMTTDVDIARLLTELRASLPGSMTIVSATVSISGATTGTATAALLDPSGRPTIGTVTLTGASQKLIDLAKYVTALEGLPGVVNVVPSTNAQGNPGAAQWTVSAQITDKFFTHRYDTATSTGGK